MAEEDVLGSGEGSLGDGIDENRGGTKGGYDELTPAAIYIDVLVDESEDCDTYE